MNSNVEDGEGRNSRGPLLVTKFRPSVCLVCQSNAEKRRSTKKRKILSRVNSLLLREQPTPVEYATTYYAERSGRRPEPMG